MIFLAHPQTLLIVDSDPCLPAQRYFREEGSLRHDGATNNGSILGRLGVRKSRRQQHPSW